MTAISLDENIDFRTWQSRPTENTRCERSPDQRTGAQLTWAVGVKPRKMATGEFVNILIRYAKWCRLWLFSRGLLQQWNDLTRFVFWKDHSEGSGEDLLDFTHISSSEIKGDLLAWLLHGWMWQIMVTWTESVTTGWSKGNCSEICLGSRSKWIW